MEHARAWAQASRNAAVVHLAGTGIPSPVAETFLGLVPSSLVPNRDGMALLIAQRQRAGLRGGNVTYSDLVDSNLLEKAASSLEPN
jgi:hypothetical protein